MVLGFGISHMSSAKGLLVHVRFGQQMVTLRFRV